MGMGNGGGSVGDFFLFWTIPMKERERCSTGSATIITRDVLHQAASSAGSCYFAEPHVTHRSRVLGQTAHHDEAEAINHTPQGGSFTHTRIV